MVVGRSEGPSGGIGVGVGVGKGIGVAVGMSGIKDWVGTAVGPAPVEQAARAITRVIMAPITRIEGFPESLLALPGS